MNYYFLLLISQITKTLNEQTKTKPQETLEIKLNKQMETFSFSPPIHLVAEEKWLLAVTSLETTNCIFNKTNENSSFSISTPSYWPPGDGEELISKLNNFIKPRFEIDIELHVKELKKRSPPLEKETSG